MAKNDKINNFIIISMGLGTTTIWTNFNYYFQQENRPLLTKFFRWPPTILVEISALRPSAYHIILSKFLSVCSFLQIYIFFVFVLCISHIFRGLYAIYELKILQNDIPSPCLNLYAMIDHSFNVSMVTYEFISFLVIMGVNLLQLWMKL